MRPKLSYANVISTLCLFLLLAGGAAYAASHLAKNSVGSKQIKKNAVTTAKIKKNAITGVKVKDGSLTGNDLADGTITGAKVADGSLSGSDIDQSSLASVRASNVIGVALEPGCSAAAPFPSGVSAVSSGPGCKVIFASSVLDCTAAATVGIRTGGAVIAAERPVYTLRNPKFPNQIITIPYNAGTETSLPVDLILVC
jgi:hypothetical protein